MNVFQLNKLSKLHNGKTIFFTKTDYLDKDFLKISNLENEVILISGNSDFIIEKNWVNRIPHNIKAWFATNLTVEHPKAIPIPLGIENYEESKRPEHGIGYHRGLVKEKFIMDFVDRKPTEFIYSNFRWGTNTNSRTPVMNLSKSIEHITWEEPTLSHEAFLDRILDFEAVLCPQGNGLGDNHRIYETLYLNRIPIVFGPHMYKTLHHKLPVVFLEHIHSLRDYNFIKEQIEIAKNKQWDKNLLDLDYWEKQILSMI